MALEVDHRGELWAGTLDAGLNRYDAASETFERIELPQGTEGRGSEAVTSLLEDARGRLWLGTFGGGLLQFDPQSSTFERFMVGETVMCLAEDGEGRLWFGTNGQGLVLFDRQPEQRRRFRHDPDDAASLSADTVSALYADRTGELWVGTRGGGLGVLDLGELSDDPASFRNYTSRDGLSNDVVYGIEPDTQDRLWLSTNFGLSVFDPADETFTTYQASQGLQLDEFSFGAHYSSPSGELF
ncbi:MAG: histidine kinase, partial [bacterium]|nr:histidine kinase [bacterium]